ncbi:hypothetical protein SBA2_510010 [Acidobacteriia bacterium SbA2]|nr:hypothetical protein SBA2_510010 [Acidobacteriia bacterium SbA2]
MPLHGGKRLAQFAWDSQTYLSQRHRGRVLSLAFAAVLYHLLRHCAVALASLGFSAPPCASSPNFQVIVKIAANRAFGHGH